MRFKPGRFDRRTLPALVMTPSMLRMVMNVAPPLLFLGVHVERFADDWTSAEVSLKVRRWNSNHNGAAPGWSLFAMTDPFFGMMAYGQLGSGYRVWNTTAEIEFLAPRRGTVRSTMVMPRELVDEIRRATADGAKSVTDHEAQLVDSNGVVIARARQKLHVRRSAVASSFS
jgi:acyl-coenzyme A thioesterase PaaI-like protein